MIELPYKDEDFAMYLILPPEDMDVRDFNWTELDLHNLNEKKMKNEYVTIELPNSKLITRRTFKMFSRIWVLPTLLAQQVIIKDT